MGMEMRMEMEIARLLKRLSAEGGFHRHTVVEPGHPPRGLGWKTCEKFEAIRHAKPDWLNVSIRVASSPHFLTSWISERKILNRLWQDFRFRQQQNSAHPEKTLETSERTTTLCLGSATPGPPASKTRERAGRCASNEETAKRKTSEKYASCLFRDLSIVRQLRGQPRRRAAPPVSPPTYFVA